MPFGFEGGKIWCFNEEWKVISYDIKTGKASLEVQVPLPAIKSVNIYNAELDYFYKRMPFFDLNDNICFVGKKNIVLYNVRDKSIRYPLNHSPKDITLLSVAYDKSEDKTYIGTLNKGFIVFENNFRSNNFFIAGKTVSNIAIHGKYIFAKFDKLRKYSIEVFDKQFNPISSIPKFYTAFSFSFDKAGRLWFCEDGFGQVVLNFDEGGLKNSLNLSDGNRYFPTGVGRFAELPNRDILVQAQIIFDPKTQSYHHLNFKSKSEIFNIYSDHFRNEIWGINYQPLQKGKGILVRFDEHFRPIEQFPFEIGELDRNQHMLLIKDHNPLIYTSNGFFWLNRNLKKFDKVLELPNTNPFYVSQLNDNRFAISYIGGDMLLVKLNDNGKFSVLSKILPEIQSYYMQEDTTNQCYYVGTNEGVYLLNNSFQIKKKFDRSNGLAGTNIYGLLLDDFGKIWCSHQKGLSTIDTKTFQITNFDKEDGIQGWDFNNRSFLKASDGSLYFGGVTGFNYIKPPILLNEVYKPEIYIDEISINNHLFEPKEGVNKIKTLHVSDDENDISIKALIKDLQYSKQRVLMYKIGNKDLSWIKVAAKSKINFRNLAPGKYTIELAYTDKFNQQIIPQKTIEIIVDSAFYQTVWFWVVVAILLSGLTFFIVGKLKFANQQRKLKVHLALENQRNKITSDLHDDIGATLSSLQINSAIAKEYIKKQKLEAAQKVLHNIEKQSRTLSENMSEIVWSLKPNKEALMQLSIRVRNIASDILGSMDINYEIQIDKAIDAQIENYSFKKNMILIIKEALNNAAKYSRAKNVLIILKVDDREYYIEISDDGIGFDCTKSQGNGIGNMKRRTEEMNGIFEMNGINGMSIKVRIPKFRGL